MVEVFIKALTDVFRDLFESPFLPLAATWLLIAAILLLVELVHRAWMVVWFSVGAVAAAVVALFFPEAKAIQITVFFAVTAVSLGVFVLYRHRQNQDEQLPAPVLPGNKVLVKETISREANTGVIIDHGVIYKARLEDGGPPIQQGQTVEAVDFKKNELVVIVKPLD